MYHRYGNLGARVERTARRATVMRIVSLLPSATEIICQLGLENELVGVTHECDYPPSVRALPKVTRTLIPAAASSREIDELVRERLKTERALYTLDLPMLAELQPDLIVTQALCDVCAVAEAEVRTAACSLPGQPRVINLEPTCLDDVFECLRLVGDATGRDERAADEIAKLRRPRCGGGRSVGAHRKPPARRRPRMDRSAFFQRPLESRAGPACRWSRKWLATRASARALLDWQQIVAAAPEVMLIACCGFDVERTLADLPILRSYPGWSELPCVRSQRVYVVDGSAYFSRPGPRLVDSLEILAHALDPKTHPLPAGLPAARPVIPPRL